MGSLLMVSVSGAESSSSYRHHLALWASHSAVESSCVSTPDGRSPQTRVWRAWKAASNAWKDWGPLTGSLRKMLFRMYKLSGERAASRESPPETDIQHTYICKTSAWRVRETPKAHSLSSRSFWPGCGEGKAGPFRRTERSCWARVWTKARAPDGLPLEVHMAVL